MFSCPCTAEAEPSLSWVTATLKWATEYQLRPWWFEEDAPTALFLSTEGSPVHDFGHNHLYSDWAPFRDDQERCWITICCPQSAELKSNSTNSSAGISKPDSFLLCSQAHPPAVRPLLSSSCEGPLLQQMQTQVSLYRQELAQLSWDTPVMREILAKTPLKNPCVSLPSPSLSPQISAL